MCFSFSAPSHELLPGLQREGETKVGLKLTFDVYGNIYFLRIWVMHFRPNLCNITLGLCAFQLSLNVSFKACLFSCSRYKLYCIRKANKASKVTLNGLWVVTVYRGFPYFKWAFRGTTQWAWLVYVQLELGTIGFIKKIHKKYLMYKAEKCKQPEI